jgi:hypothetical protein
MTSLDVFAVKIDAVGVFALFFAACAVVFVLGWTWEKLQSILKERLRVKAQEIENEVLRRENLAARLAELTSLDRRD